MKEENKTEVILEHNITKEENKPEIKEKFYSFNPELIELIKYKLGNTQSFENLHSIISALKMNKLTKKQVEAIINNLAKFPYNTVEDILNNINKFIIVE
ncbi:MAG: hypothetical protein RSE41_02615 [Clostridia bacterium]